MSPQCSFLVSTTPKARHETQYVSRNFRHSFFRLNHSSLPYIECRAGDGKIIKILIDTGFNKNYVQSKLIQKPIPNKEIFHAHTINGAIEITHHTFANLFGINKKIKFFLLPTLASFHAILWNDSLKEFSASIHTKDDILEIGNGIKIPMKQFPSTSVNSIKINTESLSEKQKLFIENIEKKLPNLFSEPEERLTYTTKVQGEIRTSTETPVYTKYYPYPISLKPQIEEQIKQLLDDGIIRPSRSPYNSPVWIVPKKAGNSEEKKYRMVIDYRKLNAVTVSDTYPIPDINEVLSQFRDCKCFSVIDLKSGFHQIPLKSSDIEKTAFSVSQGKYEFTRLPFGLKNAPSIFQRALDDILRSHIGILCYVYIDDIIIFSKTEKEHAKDIWEVFKTLNGANMKIQLEKSTFFKDEVEFLGFIVSSNGIKSNPNKVQSIQNFPAPQNLRDLRSFLHRKKCLQSNQLLPTVIF